MDRASTADPGPFRVGIACFSSPRVALVDAAPAFEKLLQGPFERVLPYSGQPPAEADFLVSAVLGEHALSLSVTDPRTKERLSLPGLHHWIGGPFMSYDTTLCALTLVTLTWFMFPAYSKDVGSRYASHYNGALYGAMNALAAKLNELAPGLAAYKKTSERAAGVESQADELLRSGDKAAAFGVLAGAAAGLPFQTTLYQRLTAKLLPLAAFGEPPALSDDARRLMVQGQTKFKDGAFVPAIETFQQVLELAPWWASAWFNLGLAQEGAKRYKDAAASFERYAQAAPLAKDAEDAKRRAWALLAK